MGLTYIIYSHCQGQRLILSRELLLSKKDDKFMQLEEFRNLLSAFKDCTFKQCSQFEMRFFFEAKLPSVSV